MLNVKGDVVKKGIIVIIAVVVVAAGVFLVTKKDDASKSSQSSESSKTTSGQSQTSNKGKTACELLTLADAKTLLGENATLNEGSGSPTMASTEGVNVDVCSYSADGATIGDTKQLTLESHYGDKAQVKAGYDNYKQTYPGEAITGLGDVAYYATEIKQVHVLKGDYWLFVAGGSINDGGNKDLEINATKTALQKL